MAKDDSQASPNIVAGWHEKVALPDLGIEQAFAKLDTGADSSTLHARDIAIVGKGDARRVEFTAPLLRRQESCKEWPGGGVRRVQAPLVEERIIRSSNGEDEARVVIATQLVLGELTFEARFSLTSREGLRFPLLIGRDALQGRVLVDAGRAHLLG
jgi:hypothetical protein